MIHLCRILARLLRGMLLLLSISAVLFSAKSFSAAPNAASPVLLLPKRGLQADQLAIVINTRDPLSRKIADYYRQRHHIPRRNLIRLEFDPDKTVMHPGVFAVLQKTLQAETPKSVQAYLLTWDQPYRVGCMSISSAFAFGFDIKYCAKDCSNTEVDNYAFSDSETPYDDFGIRPTMLLAAQSFDQAKALIDRGLKARGWYFRGPEKKPAAYLVVTPDKERSVRKVYFPAIKDRFSNRLLVNIEHSEGVEGANDILFYFTGDRFVKGLDSNHYVPGAVADHLTSSGGRLTDSRQMSALEWLRAGATGSYGTVVEPCNILGKFPNPLRMMDQYLSGHTLMESYWKSVMMPGQGVFIGDPLAAPFQGYRLVKSKHYITVHTAQLQPGSYKLLAAKTAAGPFQLLTSGIEIGRGAQTFTLHPPYFRFYKVEKLLSVGDWLPQGLPPFSDRPGPGNLAP